MTDVFKWSGGETLQGAYGQLMKREGEEREAGGEEEDKQSQ